MTSLVVKNVVPSEHELSVFRVMAQNAANSKLYRGIGDESAVMTIMLAARELDIPPMAALNGGINIIQGKTEISARMMAALIMKSGHILRIIESTPDKCRVLGIRCDNQEKCEETFTMDEAKMASLVKAGGNWTKWPKDMLYARTISRLARRLFPDVIGMGYVEGEIRESEARPTVAEDVEDISVPEEELLQKFLSQFDKDESREWSAYIGALREKLQIGIQQIISKYDENPEVATEKMRSWVAKQLSEG